MDNIINVSEEIPVEKKNKKTVSPWVARHKQLCKEIHETYVKKDSDYKGSFHDTYKKFGITSAAIRLSDKYNRAMNLIEGHDAKVSNESLRDTLIDLAGYCLLTVMELENSAKRRT